MILLNENTLLLLDPKQRGQDRAETLQNVKNLPSHLKPGLLQLLVLPEKTADGQTQLQLPSGQIITADIPDNIPAGSKLLVQLRGQGTTPQILRVLLPQTTETPAQLRASTSPPILLDVAANDLATVGQTVKFQLPALGAPNTSAFLPNPGISVLGRTPTLPQQGLQAFLLANGQQLDLLTPPVFDQNAEVVLKIGQNQTAVVDKITLPQALQQTYTETQAPQGQFPRQVFLPSDGQATAPRLTLPLSFTPQAPIPPEIGVNTTPQQVQVQQVVPQPNGTNSVTLVAQNGVSLTLNIPEELSQQLGLRPTTTASSSQAATQQPATHPQTMTIRFTDAGIIEVLSTASGRMPTGVDERHADQSRQQYQPPQGQGGREGQAQQAPASPQGRAPLLSAGHIATGHVVEQRPGGEVVLQFGENVRTSVMAQRLLPVGSQISVHIMPDGHAEILDMVLPKGSERHNALLRFSLAWDTLTQAVDELETQDPAAAAKLKRTLPHANEQLLPKLVQLSQSITQQNMRAFFGDDVLNILKALGLDGMLQNDAKQLHNLHQKPDTPDGWRAMMFPYLDDQSQKIHQGSFFWRRHKKQQAEEADSLRFVLNVHLSQLGPVQLDGLMQGKETMHLKLRMTQGMAEADEKGLQQLVQNSLAAVGLRGTIQTETVSFFETDPLHDMLVPDEDEDHHNLNVEA